MFWVEKSGLIGKEPGLFWEKDWGTIKAASYSQHIVPILARYTSAWRLVFMQDNASGYVAKELLSRRWKSGSGSIIIVRVRALSATCQQ
ncbi:hypothetical protein BJ878DRAFT_526925 [Calycina marina]|uniref:Uncharacterized protein n=1 Tax=Calycina marina TaxID=1763456 RepID=A0A9P7YV14_9HELO|nr:hypothetical protein BJ878DRAFT_526925 [Calycina marina]